MQVVSNNGLDLPGQRAGFLGPAYDPFVTGDPSAPGYEVPGLAPPVEIPAVRLTRRRALLDELDRAAGGLPHLGQSMLLARPHLVVQTSPIFDLFG